MELIVRSLAVFAGVLGVAVTLWGGYYMVCALMSWRRPMDYGNHPATTRFAVLVAARNEELVIGSLINSLLTQNYPPELYDVWVIPNNCTDNTALAARNFGAKVLECTVPVSSKGEVMRFAYRTLKDKGYDAFCVFDADNMADPNFLKEMNNAYRAGARAAQGYRDSKNPWDTPISACYSIYYWMMNRFHNGGKTGLGMAAMINGTGFMVAASTLEKLGGWSTRTISEDLEMSAQCALADVNQVVALGSTVLTSLAAACARPTFSPWLFLGVLVANLALTALGATLAAALVLTVEEKWSRGILKGLPVYWLFLFSWIPITLACCVKKTTVWEEIRHTRNVSAPQKVKSMVP